MYLLKLCVKRTYLIYCESTIAPFLHVFIGPAHKTKCVVKTDSQISTLGGSCDERGTRSVECQMSYREHVGMATFVNIVRRHSIDQMTAVAAAVAIQRHQ